jgi:hypothetical protein
VCAILLGAAAQAAYLVVGTLFEVVCVCAILLGAAAQAAYRCSRLNWVPYVLLGAAAQAVYRVLGTFEVVCLPYF